MSQRNARYIEETRMTLEKLSRITIAVVAAFVFLCADTSRGVQYPEEYRTWVHVKSGLVGRHSAFFESAAGLHHIYANEPAMAGYRTGAFPNGSVIVFDLLEVNEAAGNTIEGPRRRIDVMEKDGQRFAATSGWGFERFLKDSKTERATTARERAECVACHERRKEHDFVFSEFRR
jgi:cytochrome P460